MCDNCLAETKVYACRGCRIAHYCNEACQRHDWQKHRSFCKGIIPLFEQLCIRLNRGLDQYQHFADYMRGRDRMEYPMIQWMEDWLEGPYSEDVQRKRMLRKMVENEGKAWSSDVFSLYTTWSYGKEGNRYQKMTAFIKSFRDLL